LPSEALSGKDVKRVAALAQAKKTKDAKGAPMPTIANKIFTD
jgi:hypothetical protein